jgi:hypothetical protein
MIYKMFGTRLSNPWAVGIGSGSVGPFLYPRAPAGSAVGRISLCCVSSKQGGKARRGEARRGDARGGVRCVMRDAMRCDESVQEARGTGGRRGNHLGSARQGYGYYGLWASCRPLPPLDFLSHRGETVVCMHASYTTTQPHPLGRSRGCDDAALRNADAFQRRIVSGTKREHHSVCCAD